MGSAERTDTARTSETSSSGTDKLPVEQLVAADSPRATGVNEEHARTLSEVDLELPPILVDRRTRRVIDGMHRLRAAELNGRTHVRVRFFDGDSDTAFVLAVEQNIAHGLPLSLAEREAAAGRIIMSRPDWSDRAIARCTGLSDKTIAGIRRRLGGSALANGSRVGRDGRTRPVNSAEGRSRAARLLAQEPDASLRTIAHAAGVSPTTVRDVRKRLQEDADPAYLHQPQERGGGPSSHTSVQPPSEDRHESLSIVDKLNKDPSLRYTESGRHLLRWLNSHALRPDDYRQVVMLIPRHCSALVAQLARSCADAWSELAKEAERVDRSEREGH